MLIKAFIQYFIKISRKPKGCYLRLMDTFCSYCLITQFKSYGKGVYLYHPCVVTGADNFVIGNNVHINRKSFIRAEGGLYIGNNVHISRNFTLYTINHNYCGSALPYDEEIICKPVVIKDNVWIGINVTVIPGVVIGEGAIVGAGTVVSRDIPPLAIVGSAPQRVIRYRSERHYYQLLKEKKIGGVNGRLIDP